MRRYLSSVLAVVVVALLPPLRSLANAVIIEADGTMSGGNFICAGENCSCNCPFSLDFSVPGVGEGTPGGPPPSDCSDCHFDFDDCHGNPQRITVRALHAEASASGDSHHATLHVRSNGGPVDNPENDCANPQTGFSNSRADWTIIFEVSGHEEPVDISLNLQATGSAQLRVELGGVDVDGSFNGFATVTADAGGTHGSLPGGQLGPGTYALTCTCFAGSNPDPSAFNYTADVSLTAGNGASELHWSDPVGGDFGDAGKWDPPQVPSVNDTAIVDLGGATSINFADDATAARLRVSNTSVDLGGGQMQLSATSEDDPSLAVKDGGQLVLQAGKIECVLAVIDSGGVAGVEGASANGSPTGSTLSVHALRVGSLSNDAAKQSAGKLEVRNGATVDAVGDPADQVALEQGGSILVSGVSNSGPAQLTTQSLLVAGPTQLSGVSLADVGAATLTVEQGGVVNVLDAMTIAPGSIIPDTVTIRTGGKITAKQLSLGNDGQPVGQSELALLSVSDRPAGAGPQDALTVDGLTTIGGANAQLTMSGGAQAQFNGGLEIRPTGNAVFNVSGDGTFANVQGTLTIAGRLVNSTASVVVEDGAIVNGRADPGKLQVGLPGEGGPGEVRITQALASNAAVPAQIGFTDVLIAQGRILIEDQGILTAANDLTVGSTTGGVGRLEVNSTFAGFPNVTCDQLVINSGGAVRCCPSGSIQANTILNQSGARLEGDVNVTGNVLTSGLVSVGCSPGTMTIQGDFTQTAEAVLEIEIAGLGDGAFDVLSVTGNAALAGTVEVHFLGDFLPKVGDSVEFMGVGGTVTGNFETVSFPELADGFDADLELTPEGKLRLTAKTDAVAGDGTSLTPPTDLVAASTIPTAAQTTAPAACGAGACGAGIAVMLGLSILGIKLMKQSCRSSHRRPPDTPPS